MRNLEQHIEYLLLDNDCVIIPDFGGFITHRQSSAYDASEKVWALPTRRVGFNGKLTLNDGLLVQSYMAAYGASFADACKLVKKDVKELHRTLQEEGRVEFGNLGTFSCNMQRDYVFTPNNQYRAAEPALFGMTDAFMRPLSELPKPEVRVAAKKEAPITRRVALRPVYWAAAAAVCAVLLVGAFLFSSPVAERDAAGESYAKVVPDAKDALSIEPVVSTAEPAPAAVSPEGESFHVIVCSAVTPECADMFMDQLRANGFDHARILDAGTGTNKISAASFASSNEAYEAIRQWQSEGRINQAWVLKRTGNE